MGLKPRAKQKEGQSKRRERRLLPALRATSLRKKLKEAKPKGIAKRGKGLLYTKRHTRYETGYVLGQAKLFHVLFKSIFPSKFRTRPTQTLDNG
ncbi:hypothetical protein Tco_1513166, partial [Tanacetum coccineum]